MAINVKLGIDISHHQRTINLSAVKRDFTILKATEGYNYTDPKFQDFAKQVTGPKGFYHFARADLNKGAAGAKREAEWFAQIVKPHLTTETILILDWEGASVNAGAGWAETWLDEVHRLTGIRAYFYSNPNVLGLYDWSKVAKNHKLWLASYGADKPISGYNPPKRPTAKYWGENVAIHQYSQYGKLPGYSGNLDLNVAYDVPEWAGKTAAPAPATKGMQSPVQGRVSSPYGNRGGFFHGGIDIAAPVGTVVYPPFAVSTVVMVVKGRKRGQTGGHPLPGRTPNGVLLRNPDGEHQWLGHVDPSVKEGQTVYFNTPLGKIDLSGNTTGGHVHLETWTNSNHTSHRDPMIYFNYHGVVPGSKPHLGGKDADKPKPPAPKPTPKPDSAEVKRVKGFQTKLKAMGLYKGDIDGDEGPMTQAATLQYQKDLNKYAGAGLVEDGRWGSVTENWYQWVRSLQTVLPAWRGVPKLRVDGHYGKVTSDAVKVLQRNNRNAVNPPLVVDGKAQAITLGYMRKHGTSISNPPKNRP